MVSFLVNLSSLIANGQHRKSQGGDFSISVGGKEGKVKPNHNAKALNVCLRSLELVWRRYTHSTKSLAIALNNKPGIEGG